MTNYDSNRHHRRSIRLRGYDYTRSGAYFVTVCTQNRLYLFGEVAHGYMRLNDAGFMVQRVWDELPQYYPGVDIDEFVVMPNHIHGIIVLSNAPVGAGPRACPDNAALSSLGQQSRQPRQQSDEVIGLPDVVHRFKSFTTDRYRRGVGESGWTPFPGRLWQRNYHEHIIRDEDALYQIRRYIMNNPMRWTIDRENPDAIVKEAKTPWDVLRSGKIWKKGSRITASLALHLHKLHIQPTRLSSVYPDSQHWTGMTILFILLGVF